MKTAPSNSPNSPEQGMSTETNDYISARTGAKRRIDAATISELAQLCAKQLTESESCRLLGLNPRQWLNWKHKHKRAEKFAALLEEFRAGRINDLLAKIENSASGINMKQPDWRAAAFLLSVADAKRFSTSGGAPAETVVNQTAIVIQAGGEENLRRMIEHYAGQARQMKALPSAEAEKAPVIQLESRALIEDKAV